MHRHGERVMRKQAKACQCCRRSSCWHQHAQGRAKAEVASAGASEAANTTACPLRSLTPLAGAPGPEHAPITPMAQSCWRVCVPVRAV